jgi:hypothetical protein
MHSQAKHPAELETGLELFLTSPVDWTKDQVKQIYRALSGPKDLTVKITEIEPEQTPICPDPIEKEVHDLNLDMSHFTLDQLIQIFSGVLRKRLRQIADEFQII